MNSILVSFKKFITNKNIVTVLGVIVILGLLYWGYNSVIEAQVKPIQIPVATQTIQPKTLITDDMVTYIFELYHNKELRKKSKKIMLLMQENFLCLLL